MKLHFRKSGAGQPLIILHGLLGSSDNWFSLAKVFAQSFEVFLVDQRNHGQSPHSAEFNYGLMTEDLREFIEEHHLQAPLIIGHSMGGKTAMNFAVKYPDRVSRLVVVDIVPKAYPVHHDHILDGLHAIDLATLSSRSQADALLSNHVSEPDVRQFLLKNLYRTTEGRFAWRVNLAAIDAHIEEIGAGMVFKGTYSGPALFVKGARSNYYAPGDEQLINAIFTNAQLVTLNTGHWVQAENPEAFSQTVLQFLNTA
ncbi:MAG: alpha/beta fold hydrolase [Cyclobacteriaceae bacterium]|nr:alpha/beta fold hydrolase [Cytophagales bacterium]MBX2899426.1 alpha/beta fold hydrolase [Cyclobacteriaceae bacterium]